jgi:alpha/beta superfamily hydrolase
MTWSLAMRECGTAYGQGDLVDAAEAIDWLNRSGKTILGVNRIYVAGYSRGASVATLLNRERRVTAVVSIGGLAEPNQLEQNWFLYRLAGSLYPRNTGLCQLFSTLDFYGPPGAAAWEALDTVANVSELISPMLLIHGTNDQIYSVDNTRDLQAAYEAALAGGAMLPEVQFRYVDGADHFTVTDLPEVTDWILDFLNQFEPATN